MTGNKIYKAVIGKLLPQFVIWVLMGFAYLIILYGYWHFPLYSGLLPMIVLMIVFVVVCQWFGVFLCGAVPSLRWALSLATLWGVLSFPICGFSFSLTLSCPPVIYGAVPGHFKSVRGDLPCDYSISCACTSFIIISREWAAAISRKARNKAQKPACVLLNHFAAFRYKNFETAAAPIWTCEAFALVPVHTAPENPAKAVQIWFT